MKPPILSDEDLFMNFYHDGYNSMEEGEDVKRFMKSRDGQRAIEIAQAQRDVDIKWFLEWLGLPEHRLTPNSDLSLVDRQDLSQLEEEK